MHVQYKSLVDRRWQHKPKLAEQAEHWWAATGHALRDLQSFGHRHKPTVKFLFKQGQELILNPDLVGGGASENLAWQLTLMLPHDHVRELANLRAAAGVQRRDWAAAAKQDSQDSWREWLAEALATAGAGKAHRITKPKDYSCKPQKSSW